MEKTIVAERLKQIKKEVSNRRGKKLTTLEFAQILGVSKRTMDRFLNAQSIPTEKQLRNMPPDFNASTNWVLGNTDMRLLEPFMGLTKENVDNIFSGLDKLSNEAKYLGHPLLFAKYDSKIDEYTLEEYKKKTINARAYFYNIFNEETLNEKVEMTIRKYYRDLYEKTCMVYTLRGIDSHLRTVDLLEILENMSEKENEKI